MSRSPLLHPLWWGALLVLITNDHFLKTAGLLPPWMTGKLSDFAGLIVAPVLAAHLLRARGPRVRALVYLAVVSPFVVINLSSDAARVFEIFTVMIGVPWSVVTDPTDLIALAVLPAAWRLEARPLRRRVVERCAVLVGTVACLASSPPRPPAWFTKSFALNKTGRAIDLRVRWVDAEIDCDALEGQAGRALSLKAFGEGRTFTLPPDETIALDRTALFTGGSTQAADRRADDECDAMLLQTDGMADTVVFRRGLEAHRVPVSWTDEDEKEDEEEETFDRRGLLLLTSRGDTIEGTSTDGLEVAPLTARFEPSSCASVAAQRFQWSELSFLAEHTLRDVNVGPDGCVALQFEGTTRTRYLCVPAEEFPFAPGDHISMEQTTSDTGRRLKIVRRETSERPAVEMILTTGARAIQETAAEGEVIDLSCDGERLPCGSYSQPVAVELQGGVRLVQGVGVDLPATASGDSVRMVLGRAERFVVGATSCGAGQDRVGALVDLMIVKRGGQ